MSDSSQSDNNKNIDNLKPIEYSVADKDDNNKNNKSYWFNNGRWHILIALIAGAASLTGSWLIFKGDQAIAEPQTIAVLFDQINQLGAEISRLNEVNDSLRREMITLQRSILEKDAEITRLIVKLQLGDITSPDAALRAYLDSIKFPSWCKIYDENENSFYMWHLNRAYELFYDISFNSYIGRTDFDLYPQNIAQEYYNNDKLTLDEKSFNLFEESAIINDAVYTLHFWKFYVPLPNQEQMICGLQVEAANDDGVGTIPWRSSLLDEFDIDDGSFLSDDGSLLSDIKITNDSIDMEDEMSYEIE